MVDALLWGGSGHMSVRVQIPFLAPKKLFYWFIFNFVAYTIIDILFDIFIKI